MLKPMALASLLLATFVAPDVFAVNHAAEESKPAAMATCTPMGTGMLCCKDGFCRQLRRIN